MSRYLSGWRRFAEQMAVWTVLPVLLMGPAGCMHQQTRLQSAEETERERYGLKTVGDITSVGNADPVSLAGVGLVVGLDGTGGDAPPDGYRSMLEDHLKKQGVKNVKEVLNSPNHAMVIVTAQIQPGTAKGDPIDVEVTLPPRSKATSLRGGYLKECVLYNYDFTNDLKPGYKGPRSALLGNQVAKAEGTLLVGFGDGDEEARARRGRIWGGARCLLDLPFTLILTPNYQKARFASLAADRVNEAFHGGAKGLPGSTIASAKNNLAVSLRVPPQYRYNLPRYLRIVRLIPMQDQADTVAEGDERSYRQRLASDLLDPARTVTSALRLEAIGQGSIPSLKAGLESQHALVRFCAAEALAYLGSPSCGEELARIVEQQPRLRAFALTAMASLDEAVCQVKLGELLATSEDDEVRYGAFRALRSLNEKNPAVDGDQLNESFWLHRVAVEAKPLVHLTSSKRAEVVLFGKEPMLAAPFSFLAGDFAITAGNDDERCTVSRFPLGGGEPTRKQCSLKVEEIVRTMAEMGALYPEVVELLQQAHACQSLSCPVRCDALPQATSVYDLVKAGQGASQDGELVPAGQDLGSTPTLYQTGYQTSLRLGNDAESTSRDKKAGAAKNAAKKQPAGAEDK